VRLEWRAARPGAPLKALRPTSRFAVAGCTCTAQWTPKGKTVDFYLSQTRDKNAATTFFRQVRPHLSSSAGMSARSKSRASSPSSSTKSSTRPSASSTPRSPWPTQDQHHCHHHRHHSPSAMTTRTSSELLRSEGCSTSQARKTEKQQKHSPHNRNPGATSTTARTNTTNADSATAASAHANQHPIAAKNAAHEHLVSRPRQDPHSMSNPSNQAGTGNCSNPKKRPIREVQWISSETGRLQQRGLIPPPGCITHLRHFTVRTLAARSC